MLGPDTFDGVPTGHSAILDSMYMLRLSRTIICPKWQACVQQQRLPILQYLFKYQVYQVSVKCSPSRREPGHRFSEVPLVVQNLTFLDNPPQYLP